MALVDYAAFVTPSPMRRVICEKADGYNRRISPFLNT